MNVLTPGDFTAAAEPFALFDEWFAEAKERAAEMLFTGKHNLT